MAEIQPRHAQYCGSDDSLSTMDCFNLGCESHSVSPVMSLLRGALLVRPVWLFVPVGLLVSVRIAGDVIWV